MKQTHLTSLLGGHSGDPIQKPKGDEKANYSNVDSNRDLAQLTDMVHYSLANGGSPLDHKQGRSILPAATSLFDQQKARDLMDSLILFNQRPDMKNLSGKDRIQAFYNIQSNNPNVEALKSNFRRIGQGPVPSYTDSPDMDLQAQQQPQVAAAGGLASNLYPQ